MKKIRLFVIIIATMVFNVTLLLSPGIANATEEPTPKQKGLLGNYQGLYICHCPDDTQNCWCN